MTHDKSTELLNKITVKSDADQIIENISFLGKNWGQPFSTSTENCYRGR